ncbi:MAG TPA: hypothetical protein VIJ33_04360 [Solirubrobacteraceae bacterium]
MTVTSSSPVIYTVGHSTRPFDELARVLEAAGVRELVDVRSVPPRAPSCR